MSTFIVPSEDVPARARRPRWRSTSIAAALVAAFAIGTFVPLAAASSEQASAEALSASVTADTLPVPQIDGIVWDQAVVGNTVYVGGQFTSARPYGAKPGQNESARSNFLAYDLKTGELLPYAPTFNGQVRTIAPSPDGKRLYVGGDFTLANGATRNRIAAFDLPTGSLSTTWKAGANKEVKTIVVSASTVFVGGSFASIHPNSASATSGAVSRMNAGAFSAATGAVVEWAPYAAAKGRNPEQIAPESTRPTDAAWALTAEGHEFVREMVISPDGSKIVLAGTFRALNGDSSRYTIGAVDTTTGTVNLPWKFSTESKLPARNLWADVATYGLASDGTSVYAVFGSGPTEGTFKMSWTDGSMQWAGDCRGDTYSVAAFGGAVYTASHAHNCATLNSFTNYVPPKGWYRSLAFTVDTTQPTSATNDRPRPSVLNWFPDFDTNTIAGQSTWDVASAQGYVLIGGEFRNVNGKPQQGLARMTTSDKAPNKVGPYLSGTEMNPTVSATGKVTAALEWGINFDWDDETLRYEVIRDGDVDAPVYATSQVSQFWKWRKSTGKDTIAQPGARIQVLKATDIGLTPGRTYTYQIRTVDPHGNAALSDVVSFTMPVDTNVSGITAYDRGVIADKPSAYWPVNEKDGVSSALDWVGKNDIRVTPRVRTAGQEKSDTGRAIAFDGKTYAASISAVPAPTATTQELWFKTTSKTGGSLMAFTSTRGQTGTWGRQIYMDRSGRVHYNGTGNASTLWSPKAYNDGAWHHVVVTSGASGTSLFVDANRVSGSTTMTARQTFAGFWNIGGMPLTGRPTFDKKVPATFLTGTIDNVAVYSSALPNATILKHYKAGVAVVNQAPTASLSSAASGFDVAFDGSRSVDKDGSIASYSWDFGDGSTGSGVKATHSYAKPGSYAVKLTVTDNANAVARATSTVTVARVGSIAEDGFGRTMDTGWGTADQGGAWSLAGAASGFSVDGGRGIVSNAAGATSSAILSGVSAGGTDSTVSFAIPEKAVAAQYVSVIGRQVGSASYSTRVVLQPDGKLQVQLFQGTTQLGKTTNVGTYTTGQTVKVRLQVAGSGTTTLSAKVWTSDAEPTAWQLEASDATAALQAPGSVGLKLYVASSGAATSVSFDAYRVTLLP